MAATKATGCYDSYCDGCYDYSYDPTTKVWPPEGLKGQRAQEEEAEGYWWWLEKTIAPISEGSGSNERGTYSGDMDGLAENDLHDALDDMADNTIR